MEQKIVDQIWDKCVSVWDDTLENAEDGILMEELFKILDHYILIEKTPKTETNITREEAISLLKPDKTGISLMEKLGIEWVMCKEYGNEYEWESDDIFDRGPKLWAGVDKSDYETIRDSDEYQSFQIW